ncbi:pyridoxamine 5'-phosphate oxidase family protein [Shimia sp.]|uniref:pyridoxamine 5'-phosphate oxidase family protein n=1 Tax=Shimia sp. TaxID=1954381 RepID=UPI003B8B4D6E
MALAFADIAFTPTVQAQQEKNGSGNYRNLLSPERQGGDRLRLAEAAFIEARDGFYQASTSETGWPYVQFRGGAPGFLSVLDEQTITYADVRGNRQYISLGNLTGNDRVALILMDYPNARRLKIWGRVQFLEQDSAEFDSLLEEPPSSNVERLVKIHVEAFDWNCPQHIPRRFTEGEAIDRIAALEAENAKLQRRLSQAVREIPSKTQ